MQTGNKERSAPDATSGATLKWNATERIRSYALKTKDSPIPIIAHQTTTTKAKIETATLEAVATSNQTT